MAELPSLLFRLLSLLETYTEPSTEAKGNYFKLVLRVRMRYDHGVVIGHTPRINHQAITMVVCFVATQAIAADSAQEIYARYADSVVTISTYDECFYPREQGTGIIIKGDQKNGSCIVTNYHVIQRAGLVHVHTKSGTTLAASVCYFDEVWDIAVLRTEMIRCTVPVTAPTVEIGSQVFTIGTPKGLGWTISNGIVSATRTKKPTELVQFTAAASPGSSGGPLFDVKGNLIGITSFKAETGENLNFALRINAQTRTDLEKHLWRGNDPSQIPEEGWCLGHSEPNDNWMERNDRAQSWKAHTTVIKELESKLRGRSRSPRERDAENREFLDAARTGGRVHLPGNVLAERVAHAYAERYEAFPEDKEGWEHGAVQVEMTTEGMHKLLAEGLKKWPHSPDVLLNIFANMQVDSPQAVPKMIEATAESLPTKKAVMSLQPVDEDTTILPKPEYRQAGIKPPIEQLVENVWVARVYFPDGPQWRDRVELLRQTLTAKGWAYLLEDSPSSQRK